MLIWWKNEGDMKMSRQDIRDEMRQTEGNPESKARVRKIQRQSRRRQMLKAAETGHCGDHEPDSLCGGAALRGEHEGAYRGGKRADNLAAKIKEVAWRLDIPLIENRPLAQALYKTVEVGDPIPSALYHAVAEILVLIYKAQTEVRNREAQWRIVSYSKAML